MAVRVLGGIARQLQVLFDHGTTTGQSDRQLLSRFAESREQEAQAAFAALVARHGPMVLRVCSAILRDTNDVEDAFQETFLVLARKARSIRATESVGSWLYGVALRTAAHTRLDATKRRQSERRCAAMRAVPAADDDRHHLEPALFEEVNRLPEKYRAPIVLCYLEGLTHLAAARRLGWPVGTVEGRLARARALLRSRLTRRGLAPALTLLAAGASLDAAPAPLSMALADSTATVALTLARDKAMLAVTSSARAAMIAKRIASNMPPISWGIVSVVMAIMIAAAIAAGWLKLDAQAARRTDQQAAAETRPTSVPVGKMRVLLLQWSNVSWEYRYLSRAVAAAPDVQLDGIILRKPAEGEKGDLEDRVLEPGRYDITIVCDLPANALTRRQQGRLAATVKQGSGLIVLGGRSSFGAGGWAGTEVAGILPVELRLNDWKEPADDAKLVLTGLGRQSWILQVRSTEAETERAWASLPPLTEFNRFGESRALTTVLARTKGGDTLLAAVEVGRGRVLAFAGQTWPWFRFSDGGRQIHRDFWRRALHWAGHRQIPGE